MSNGKRFQEICQFFESSFITLFDHRPQGAAKFVKGLLKIF